MTPIELMDGCREVVQAHPEMTPWKWAVFIAVGIVLARIAYVEIRDTARGVRKPTLREWWAERPRWRDFRDGARK